MSTNHLIFSEEETFEIGEETLVQPVGATVINMASRTTVPQHRRTPRVDDDAVERLERKLDAAIRQIVALTQRLESMDVTLARVVSR